MLRPAGVVIVAVLYWLSAFFLLLVGGIMAIGFTAFSALRNGVPPFLAGLGVIGGIIFLGLGAAMALIGYSLFQLQEWARVTTIVLVAIGFAAAIFGFMHPFGFGRVSAILRMAIDGFIIWYLVQPQVVGAFRRA